MNISLKTHPSEESQIALDALRTAVENALEKKRRLGQYAVVWKNGKPVRIDADAISADHAR